MLVGGAGSSQNEMTMNKDVHTSKPMQADLDSCPISRHEVQGNAKHRMVTVLVPVFNEESVIIYFYNELMKHLRCVFDRYRFEFLFVNDGSIDNSLSVLQQLRESDGRCCIVDLSRNFGKENAMLAGLDYAEGDCVIIIDCDLQDPPSLIPEMLAFWEQGFDDVYARRINRGKEGLCRRILSKLYYRLLQKMCNFDILANVGDFRLLDHKCVAAIKMMREQERYSKGIFAWIGFRKKELVFKRDNRIKGESHFKFGNLFRLAVDGITSFSNFPLRIVTIAGLMVAIGTLAYSMYFFFKTLFFGDDAQGFPTLIITILLLGGIQIMAIGIVGEYVGRIFNESKHRPIYLVRNYYGQTY